MKIVHIVQWTAYRFTYTKSVHKSFFHGSDAVILDDQVFLRVTILPCVHELTRSHFG